MLEEERKDMLRSAMAMVAEMANKFGMASFAMEKVEDTKVAQSFLDLNKYIGYGITLFPDSVLDQKTRDQVETFMPVAANDVLFRSTIKCCSDLIDILSNPEHQREEKERRQYSMAMVKSLQSLVDFMQPWYTNHKKMADEIVDKFGSKE